MNEVFAHSALIKHKHVVRYYNSWVENGRVYIQNEFCEGGSLAAKIREFKETGKRFTEAELKRILLHLAKGLDYIHSKFLVHLDVKPENIFIGIDGICKLGDFGLVIDLAKMDSSKAVEGDPRYSILF